MTRQPLRAGPGDSTAGTIATTTAIGRLGGWFRGVRIRQVVSVPIWLSAFGLLLVGDLLPRLVPVSQFMNARRGSNLADLLGVLLMVLAARLGASTAKQLRAMQPGRRPVLYLRSFKADRNPVSTSADEEVLSRVFRAIGPFVAFEEPGERLPDLGSAKMSASFSDWQDHVSEQIRQAELVVLNVGETPSFLWEVKRALELAEPERVLIYFSMHADEYHLRGMYRSFVEAARELVPHPFPPDSEIGTRRFIRFDADRRPELFGPIGQPRTTWRTVVGVLSLGMGLVVLRPVVAERLRHRVSTALAPIRARYDPDSSTRRVWGRLTVAVGVYLAGLAALLPMVAWNAWRPRDRRAGVAALACLPLVLVAPVNEAIRHFSMVFAIIVYLAWPVVMPMATRRHIVLGGPVFGPRAATLVIVAALGASMLLPSGFSQDVGETDRAALLDIDGLRAVLPPDLAVLGANPSRVSSHKRSSLDGTFDLEYRYEAPDLVLRSALTVVDPTIAELTDGLGGEFPGLDATVNSSAAHEGWRIDAYDLTAEGQPAGVGATARKGSLRYSLVLAGLALPADGLVTLMRPRLDAAARVTGLFPTFGY